MKVISCKDAKAKGMKRYFTGKPCKHGHVDERFTCNRECIECDAVRKQSRKITSRISDVTCNFVSYVKMKKIRVVKFDVDRTSLYRKGRNKFDAVVLSDNVFMM